MVLALLMIAGLPLGALGIVIAHVATSVFTIPLKLYYSFKGSPVTLKSFWSAIRMALASSVFMGVSLLVFHLTSPIAHPIHSLLAGCGIGAVTYLVPWLLLPSGRAELWVILHDIQNALLRRSITADPTAAGKRQESHAAT
jgi:hypothetical protein